jgi:hypothetical protein
MSKSIFPYVTIGAAIAGIWLAAPVAVSPPTPVAAIQLTSVAAPLPLGPGPFVPHDEAHDDPHCPKNPPGNWGIIGRNHDCYLFDLSPYGKSGEVWNPANTQQIASWGDAGFSINGQGGPWSKVTPEQCNELRTLTNGEFNFAQYGCK